MRYDDLIKFRATGDLKTRLEAIARQQRRDVSDLYRLVLEDYANHWEQNALHGLSIVSSVEKTSQEGKAIKSKLKASSARISSSTSSK